MQNRNVRGTEQKIAAQANQIRNLERKLANKGGYQQRNRKNSPRKSGKFQRRMMHFGGKAHDNKNSVTYRENTAAYVKFERVFVTDVEGDVESFQKTIEKLPTEQLGQIGWSLDGTSAHLVAYREEALSLTDAPTGYGNDLRISQRPGFQYLNAVQTIDKVTLVTGGKFMPDGSPLFKAAVQALSMKQGDVRFLANPNHATRSWVKVGTDMSPVLLRNGAFTSAFLHRQGTEVLLITFAKTMILASAAKNATQSKQWDLVGSTPYPLYSRVSREIHKTTKVSQVIANGKDGHAYLVSLPFAVGEKVTVTPLNGGQRINGEMIGATKSGVALIARNARGHKQVSLEILPLGNVIADLVAKESPAYQNAPRN